MGPSEKKKIKKKNLMIMKIGSPATWDLNEGFSPVHLTRIFSIGAVFKVCNLSFSKAGYVFC